MEFSDAELHVLSDYFENWFYECFSNPDHKPTEPAPEVYSLAQKFGFWIARNGELWDLRAGMARCLDQIPKLSKEQQAEILKALKEAK